jgi:DNA-binding LacI/PurR family transcriptional regulator
VATEGQRETLESVARRALVSRQTVSNVINAPHRVQDDTLARVQSAIDDLGYRPSHAARQMRTRRSHVLGIRIEPMRDGVNGAVLDHFLHALTEEAQALGYHLMLFTAGDDQGEILAYEELTASRDIDGFVLTSTHHGDVRTAWLAEHGVPVVTFGRPWGAEHRHAWVDVDGAHGTAAAVDHLVANGHRDIAFVGWPTGSGSGDDRRSGWRRAMTAHGLDADGREVWVEDGVVTGRHAGRALLDGVDAGNRGAPGAPRPRVQPTAFVCTSDSLALGVRDEVIGRRLIPGVDVAIVGFDDTPIAQTTGLSSIAQPVVPVAKECARLLHRQLAGHADTTPATVLLPPELKVRASSAPTRRAESPTSSLPTNNSKS